MLKREGAAATIERSRDLLHRDVTGRALDGRADGEHFAFAGRFEVTVELFVDRHAAYGGGPGFVVLRLRGQLHFKRSACMSRHDCFLLLRISTV